MKSDKQFHMHSNLTSEQARVMLAIMTHLFGNDVNDPESVTKPSRSVVITKEQFESIPEYSLLSLFADEETGSITVKLEEYNGH